MVRYDCVKHTMCIAVYKITIQCIDLLCIFDLFIV